MYTKYMELFRKRLRKMDEIGDWKIRMGEMGGRLGG
jgi:hypothetical protein